MASWPPAPPHFYLAASGALQPPPPPAPGATYVCFGESFPREAHRPPARDEQADAVGALRALHASFASGYLELLTAMTAAPSAVYELQLKAQALEEIVTRMQKLLADEARHWEAGDELVRAMREQTARKAQLARALDAASDTAEAQLRELLGPAPAFDTAEAASDAPPSAAGRGAARAAGNDEPSASAAPGASSAVGDAACVRAALRAVGAALDATAWPPQMR